MKQKTLKLYEWLFRAKRIIQKRLKHDDHIFVFVAWGSASGKTSRVAKVIQYFFPNDSILISMDNYYRGKKYVAENNITFDEPCAIDIDLLYHHLELLKHWETVHIPEYDFKNSKPIFDKICIKPAQIMIVEGLFTLDDRFHKIADLNIFVETSTSGRLVRRVLRDTTRTNLSSQEIVQYFLWVVDPMHKKYIEPQKKRADLIILNEFDPFLEVRHLDIPEFMKKHQIPNLD